MRPRAVAPLLLLVLLLASFGDASAAVRRFPVVDAEGDRLVRVTYDDDKAIRAGEARGFLFLVERIDASKNLTVFLDVIVYNESAFDVTSLPKLTPLGDGPADLNVRIRSHPDAETRRYPLTLELTVVNLNATTNATVLTSAALPLAITLTPFPTPLGETGSTLSEGEWAALGAVGGVLALGLVAAVWRSRAARARRDER